MGTPVLPVLPPGGDVPAYCDICRIVDPDKRKEHDEYDPRIRATGNRTQLRLKVECPTAANNHLLPPGTFRIRITLAARDVKSETNDIEIDGAYWYLNPDDMVKKGLYLSLEDPADTDRRRAPH